MNEIHRLSTVTRRKFGTPHPGDPIRFATTNTASRNPITSVRFNS